MNNITQDQQKIADELTALALQQVYTKIAPQLTDEDMIKIDELNQADITGNAAREFLLTKVPNFDELFQAEIDLLKSSLT